MEIGNALILQDSKDHAWGGGKSSSWSCRPDVERIRRIRKTRGFFQKNHSRTILEILVKPFPILILADRALTTPVVNSVAAAWWAVVMGQKILSISITFISLKNRELGYFRTRKFWTFNLFKQIRKAKRVTKFSAGRILLMEPKLRGHSKPGGLYFLQVFWAHCLCC